MVRWINKNKKNVMQPRVKTSNTISTGPRPGGHAGDSTAHTPCQQQLRALMSAGLLPINCPDLNLSQLQDSSLHHLVAQKRIYTKTCGKRGLLLTQEKKKALQFFTP